MDIRIVKNLWVKYKGRTCNKRLFRNFMPFNFYAMASSSTLYSLGFIFTNEVRVLLEAMLHATFSSYLYLEMFYLFSFMVWLYTDPYIPWVLSLPKNLEFCLKLYYFVSYYLLEMLCLFSFMVWLYAVPYVPLVLFLPKNLEFCLKLC